MIVLDNSLFMSALLDNEKHPFAISLYQLVLEGEENVVVPSIFLYEACNVVLNSIKRNRISEKNKQDYLDLIYSFPLLVDDEQSMPDVVNLAHKHGLTVYDASYLELAKRESLPLATFDNALIVAARQEKVYILNALN